MEFRERLEEKIKKKEQEIQEYETKINECKAYLQGLQEALKIAPKNNNGASPESKLRAGSIADMTYAFLKKAGKPLHINDILGGIGKTTSKSDRMSLSGTISSYVRKHDIFTKTAPNTFGLIIFDNALKEDKSNDDVSDLQSS